MKRIICLLLAAIMALLCLAACGNNQDDADDTSRSGQDTIEETGRQAVKDDLPDNIDYKDREFRTLIQDTYKTDMWVEKSDSGDIVADAVYARNLAVSERLGITIVESVAGDYGTISSYISQDCNSGAYNYDVVMQHMIQAGNDALKGNFLNWYNIPNVHFDREWYPQFAIQNLTVNGKMLIAVGDMLLATIDRTYCLFYDKQAATERSITDLNDLALNHEWTIDKFTEYTKDVYKDLNGDSKVDNQDYFGFANDCVNAYSVYYYCLDLDRMSINEDYEVEMNYNGHDGKINDAITKLRSLMLNDSVYQWKGSAQKDPMEMFMNGQVMIVGGIVGEALSTVRQYDHDYGLLPYPTFDTNQKNYYTIMGGGVSTMEVLKSVPSDSDLEFIGTAVEAMCSETWRSVLPQYYDVALKYKGTRDEESVQILDMILDSRAVDVAIAYDGWSGLTYKLGDFVGSNKEWTSTYKKMEKSVQKHYEKIAKVFSNLD